MSDQLRMLTRILAAIDEYVYVGEMFADGGYALLYQGPCRARFLGLEHDEEAAQAAVWAEFVHPEDRAYFDETHERSIERGSLDLEYRIVGADGATRWVRDRGRVRKEDGRVFLDGSVLDVTAIHAVQDELRATVAELESARAEAERLGRIDPLTGMANRRMLPEVLDRRLAGGEHAVGVLMLDIDRFKLVNDAHGHPAGDAVLAEVARRVRATVRAEDIVARLGGEEFLVLLHGMADAPALERIGEAIRVAVAGGPVVVGLTELAVTVSIGAALSGTGHTGHETLLAAADHALYAAKRGGRDRVVLQGA